MRILKIISTLLAMAALTFLLACRGQISDKPPIHLIPNMDNQEKYRAFGESSFFEDGRNMRPIPEGTIPRGYLQEDKGYHFGKVGERYVNNPVQPTSKVMARGRERYNIFCTACHSKAGDGKGIVVQKGFTPATSYFEDRMLNAPDGQLFEAITNGIRTMPPMRVQVPVEDRWAIVWYIRALQKSRNATITDVPEELRKSLD